MTVVYRCDGPDCEAILVEDDPRIALELVNMEPLPGLEKDDEELEPGEALAMFPVLATLNSGFSGTHHFHSAECLAAWAMSKHLEVE